MRLIVATVEGKGGACKSTLTSTCIEALCHDGKHTILKYDGDTTNSTLKSMYPDSHIIDFSQPESGGDMVAALKSDDDFLVVDTGARDEIHIRNMMPAFAKRAAAAKVQIVTLRPITTSSFIQNNAISWAAYAAQLGIKTIFVRALCQGRMEKHFAEWTASAARARALESKMVVETDMTDAGVRWADEVPAFNLTFNEVAMGDFSRVPEDLYELATRLFTPGIQAHLGLWCEHNSGNLQSAFAKLGIKL